MFEDHDHDQDHPAISYWKLYLVVTAAILSAAIITAVASSFLFSYGLSTAANFTNSTHTKNTSSKKTDKENVFKNDNPAKRLEVMRMDCRFWSDQYNTDPTPDNAKARSDACRPFGLY